jgi:hypothetical protein
MSLNNPHFLERVMGYPAREADRATLRQLLDRTAPGTPLPAIYPGAVELPCSQCGMICTVGPRSRAKLAEGVPLYCIWCLLKEAAETSIEPTVVDLGNPDSAPEELPSAWD